MNEESKPCPAALSVGCNGKGEAQDPHPCPFAVEINNDSETLCECCETCEGECAMDI